MEILVALEGVVILLLGVLVVGLLRSHAEVLRALHDVGVSLEPGPPLAAGPTRPTGEAHDLVGITSDGETAHIAVNGSARPTLLAFLSTGCLTCAGFWRDLRDPPPAVAGARVVVVTQGPEQESPSEVARLAPPQLTTLQSSQAWQAYGVPGAPYFVLVDGDGGVVGEGTGSTWAQVTALLSRALADAGFGRRSRREFLTGRERETRADSELLAAGIEPGDPSLYRAQ